jgi:hypothetical protein
MEKSNEKMTTWEIGLALHSGIRRRSGRTKREIERNPPKGGGWTISVQTFLEFVER